MKKQRVMGVLSTVLFLFLFCVISVAHAAKSITVQSPNGGETVKAGEKITIRWKSSGLSGKVRVILRKGNRVVKRLHKPGGEPKKGRLNWTIPADMAPGNDYLIRIRGIDAEASVADDSNRTFTIQSPRRAAEEGSVTVTKPGRGDTLKTGDRTKIRWRKSGMTGKVRVVLRKGGRFVKNLSPPGGVPNNGQFSWTIPDSIEGGFNYQIRVRGIGDEASIMDESDGNFTIVKRSRATASTALPGGTLPNTSGIITAPAAQKAPVQQGSSTRTISTNWIKMTGIDISSGSTARTISTNWIKMTGIGESSENGPAKKKPVPMKKSSGK